ncbi:transposase [Clostridium chromiireducens]|uniref:Transposase n=1 Tax=Clostridium chromiireducens TaxID=225345 RepID=A0A399IJX8_9CLOT|nr:transposase [Clostridium chromiireducens]
MNKLYSYRDIENACIRDINFMFLLEGFTAPDHATFAIFRSLHFALCAE